MKPELTLEIMPKLIAALLASMLATPALAQFEVDPPKGYELATAEIATAGLENAAAMLLDPALALEFENAPDFYFRYWPHIPCRFGWSESSNGQTALEFFDSTSQEFIRYDFKGENIGLPAGLTGKMFAVSGLMEGRLHHIAMGNHGEVVNTEEFEFPNLSAEHVWLVDLTGDGISEIVISGMTGVSNGGGAFVFRMDEDWNPQIVTEDYDGEAWPQQLWSFYGQMDLYRTPDGKWVFKGISPVGRNQTEYFWSWFYEWDAEKQMFVTDGPSYQAEKKLQYQFFQRFRHILIELQADPQSFYVGDLGLGYQFGWSDDMYEYSLDCFLEEDGEFADWLVADTIESLNYMLDEPADGSHLIP